MIVKVSLDLAEVVGTAVLTGMSKAMGWLTSLQQ